MVRVNSIQVSPPLINTACAWASDFDQLDALFNSPYIGAVTTRTATLEGYKETEQHTVAFATASLSSLNSYGYSPYPITHYISWIEAILTSSSTQFSSKPFIISIAATTTIELDQLISAIQALRHKHSDQQTSSRIAIELNTSCPNIGISSPPTGYEIDNLRELLSCLQTAYRQDPTLTLGLKLPPYIYHKQFLHVLSVLTEFSVGGAESPRSAFAFITCTNTLGNSLLFADQADSTCANEQDFAVPTAIGGLAGEALHSLALGNVYTFHRLLHLERPQEYDSLKDMIIIGVGGVTTKQAATRMIRAGAEIVGAATLLGKEGVKAFEIITRD